MIAVPETPTPPPPGTSVETHIALIYQQLAHLVQITSDRGKDHEDRLRKLETFKWILLGLAAASGAGGGAVTALLK